MTYLFTAATALASYPGGWTLTFVSVSVVFLSLLILFLFFGLNGEISMRKSGRKDTGTDDMTAAAIAAAIDMYLGEEQVHDRTKYAITIRRSTGGWSAKGRNFRKKPTR